MLLDLAAPIGEVIDHRPVDPGDIGDAVLDRFPFDAEPSGQLVTKVGFVEVAGGLGVQVQPPPIQRPPDVIGALGHVGDEHVGVEVRVPGPAGAMPERRRDQALDLDLVDPVLPGPRSGCVAFDVGERSVDGRLVRSGHGPGRVRVAEEGEQRHGLRGPERQVVPGDLPAREPRQRLARGGVLAGPHRMQLLSGDLTLEAKGHGGGAGPTAGCFADAAVVLVDPVGHRREVVALAAQAGLADAQHRASFSGRSRPCRTSPGPGSGSPGSGPVRHRDASP